MGSRAADEADDGAVGERDPTLARGSVGRRLLRRLLVGELIPNVAEGGLRPGGGMGVIPPYQRQPGHLHLCPNFLLHLWRLFVIPSPALAKESSQDNEFLRRRVPPTAQITDDFGRRQLRVEVDQEKSVGGEGDGEGLLDVHGRVSQAFDLGLRAVGLVWH
jgi:hypothetical protein